MGLGFIIGFLCGCFFMEFIAIKKIKKALKELKAIKEGA